MFRYRTLVLTAIAFALLGLAQYASAGDTYKVLNYFSGKNGEQPEGGLIFDASGNLYGTTFYGGTACSGQGCGTAFQLVPDGAGGWTEHVIHEFCSESDCADGWYPVGALVSDASGNLYGVTDLGGAKGPSWGGGTVFQLVPGPDDTWTENVLYAFCAVSDPFCGDGYQPDGPVVFDASGNLYGTTSRGGEWGMGVVFELVPSAKGTWTEQVLYSFCSVSNCGDGDLPLGNLVFDAVGNLYGTTTYGGGGNCEESCGTVFQLTPGQEGTWTERVIDSFSSHNGAEPYGLVFDGNGNLYGAAGVGGLGGDYGNGLIFRLTPGKDDSWTETVVRHFYVRWHGPEGPLVFDSAGNLYGTTYGGGRYQYGIAFKLTPKQNGEWPLTVLHSFDPRAGMDPVDGLIFNSDGNLYGVASFGGVGSNYGDGVVFEITP